MALHKFESTVVDFTSLLLSRTLLMSSDMYSEHSFSFWDLVITVRSSGECMFVLEVRGLVDCQKLPDPVVSGLLQVVVQKFSHLDCGDYF